MLLQADVDPTIVNMSGLQAVDLLPKEETKSLEHLRMAMYSGRYTVKPVLRDHSWEEVKMVS